MKKRYIAMILLFAMLLSACNGTAPAPETTQATAAVADLVPETEAAVDATTEPSQQETTAATEQTQPETTAATEPAQPTQAPTNPPEEETTESPATEQTEPVQKEEDPREDPDSTIPVPPPSAPRLLFPGGACARVKVGESFPMPVHYTGQKKLSWSSSDPSVVTVDSNTGVITGVKAGKADIIVTDGTLRATQWVTVRDSDRFEVGIAMNDEDLVRYVGSEAEVLLQVSTFACDPPQQVQAVSGDPSVVSTTVTRRSDHEFIVILHFLKPGQTTITYTTTNSSNCRVQKVTAEALEPEEKWMTPQEWTDAMNRLLISHDMSQEFYEPYASDRYIVLSSEELTFGVAQSEAQDFFEMYDQIEDPWNCAKCYYIGLNAAGNHIFLIRYITGGNIGPNNRE